MRAIAAAWALGFGRVWCMRLGPRPLLLDRRLPQTPPASPSARLRRLAGQVRRRLAWATRTAVVSEDAHLVAAHFDAAFYRAQNPDVTAAGVDPLAHFMAYGWREGRDPTPDFSVEAYAELNPDVDAEVNPFLHYVTTGKAEGRQVKRALGFRYEILAGLVPMEKRLAAYKGRPLKASPPEDLARALAASRCGFADLHLSVSHDNYAENIGGVQLCILREARALEAKGVDHLHLYPARVLPMLRTGAGAGLIGVVWNGASVGLFEPAAIARALTQRPASGGSFALHNMLGHSADDILAILAAAGMKSGFFWLHDFASLCAGFHLMRNDVADCAAPPADSAACAVCVYRPYRDLHVAEHRRLFEALELTVVAPSQVTLDLWRRAADVPHAGELVRPHAELVRPRASEPAATDAPLRLAFVGVGAPHKGWPVFHELVTRFRDDPRYAFVHLGRKGPHGLPVEHHDVTVTAEHPQAMRDALERHAIDVALVWPLCRETFSFTAHEAAAAGAAVLTNPDSGNVCAFVAETGHGRVLPDEAALYDLFETGEVLALSRAKRAPKLYDLDFGALTAELRAPPAADPASGRR